MLRKSRSASCESGLVDIGVLGIKTYVRGPVRAVHQGEILSLATLFYLYYLSKYLVVDIFLTVV